MLGLIDPGARLSKRVGASADDAGPSGQSTDQTWRCYDISDAQLHCVRCTGGYFFVRAVLTRETSHARPFRTGGGRR